MRYTCSICGRITDQRRCPEHQLRDNHQQQKFRAAVLIRDNHRCRRCGGTEDLRAAHWPLPFRSFAPDDPMAYDARSGLTLCRDCHAALDPYAH